MRISLVLAAPALHIVFILATFCSTPAYSQEGKTQQPIRQADAPSEREKFELERKKFFWIIFGSGVTVVSVALAGISLAISWSKDKTLKRQEYADQIKKAAGQTIAKLERWSAISDNLFMEIQPTITDADIRLVTTKDVIATRDQLWRSLLEKITSRSRTILEEEIELAYVDLYGYDPGVRGLFQMALQNLRLVNEQISFQLLDRTQDDVRSFVHADNEPIHSAALGNRLRATARDLRIRSKKAMDNTIIPFQLELARLIDASDSQIANKKLRLQGPEQVFKAPT